MTIQILTYLTNAMGSFEYFPFSALPNFGIEESILRHLWLPQMKVLQNQHMQAFQDFNPDETRLSSLSAVKSTLEDTTEIDHASLRDDPCCYSKSMLIDGNRAYWETPVKPVSSSPDMTSPYSKEVVSAFGLSSVSA